MEFQRCPIAALFCSCNLLTIRHNNRNLDLVTNEVAHSAAGGGYCLWLILRVVSSLPMAVAQQPKKYYTHNSRKRNIYTQPQVLSWLPFLPLLEQLISPHSAGKYT